MSWLVMLMIGVWVGYCYGTAWPGECGAPSMYNPFVVYNTLTALQNSPWSYFAEDMADSLRQSRKELLGGAVLVASTGAAYAMGGQPMAMATLRLGASRFQEERAKRRGQIWCNQSEWVDSARRDCETRSEPRSGRLTRMTGPFGDGSDHDRSGQTRLIAVD
jgi:hypothetical protein